MGESENTMLSHGNSKIKKTGQRLGKKAACFDLPAGHTCPMANECKSMVVKRNGARKRVDFGKFVCYATKAELCYTATYNMRKSNLHETTLKRFVSGMIGEIVKSKVEIVRIHSSGDFYNWTYFQKWVAIAKSLPNVQFFAYTKQATFVKWLRDNPVPNFSMVYSCGGLMDEYASDNNLPTCYVVMTKDNPPAPIICNDDKTDDFETIVNNKSFSLMVH